jgi:acetyl esterase/lipase
MFMSTPVPLRGHARPSILAPRAAFAALAAVLATLTPVRAEEMPIKQTLDVRYGDRDMQVLDVFAPEDAHKAPVVLFVHGGTWVTGDKDFNGCYRSVGQFLARHGVVAVLINYRLSPWVRHPEHVKDVARAFAWTRRHAQEYGGDPDRIVLCGHSAGGHLVSLLATDPTYLADPALKLTAKDRAAIKGVIAACGVYRIPLADEFTEMARQILPSLLAGPDGKSRVPERMMPAVLRISAELSPFRWVFGDDPKLCRDASPLSHVHPGLPPFLLLTAEAELPRLAEMARDFHAALTRAGDEVELHCIPGSSHNCILFGLNTPDDTVGDLLLKFIAQHTATEHAGGGVRSAERTGMSPGRGMAKSPPVSPFAGSRP